MELVQTLTFLESRAKSVKLAILVGWPPVKAGHTIMEPTISHYIVHGRYSVTWPPVYPVSWPQFHI